MRKSYTLTELMAVILLIGLVIVGTITISGCTRPESATQLLEANGLTDIRITGYRPFSCSEDDSFHTGFRATGVNGQEVSGTVCAGMFFKGATIRYD